MDSLNGLTAVRSASVSPSYTSSCFGPYFILGHLSPLKRHSSELGVGQVRVHSSFLYTCDAVRLL